MSSNIRIKKSCDFCGKEYIAKTIKTRYCSHLCNSRDYKARLRKEKIEKAKKQTDIKKEISELDPINQKDFLSVKEVAVILGCSTRTVYRLINNETIMAVNLSQRLIRINRKSLEEAIPGSKAI